MTWPVQLTGIAWDHSRAFPPLVATAQRYEETHPGIRIHWEKRTLDQFGHLSIDQLAHKFDLIVIDHPWAGFAFENELTYDLKPLLPYGVLADLAQNSIGATFQSYCYERLLALPIDAAAPAPSWRPDLLERFGAVPPVTWTDAVALARRKLAVIPAFNADLFLHFLMLVQRHLGSIPGVDEGQLAPRQVMRAALDLLRELTEPMPRAIFEWNPIQLAERMTTTDDFAWNAFAYTYNNYSRDGFAPGRLQFGNLISLEPAGPRMRSVLGGTGIALSSKCRHVEIGLDYTRFVAASATQRGLSLNAGGQPSHRAVWNDSAADTLCGGFFAGTKATQEEAFIRPRYSGYVPLQTSGGCALREALRDGRDPEAVLEQLDALYRKSRQAGSSLFQTN